MITDDELLRRFVEDHSEAAFTELVQRHLPLVRATALRRVSGDAHAADDVTQQIFVEGSKGVWLFQVTFAECSKGVVTRCRK